MASTNPDSLHDVNQATLPLHIDTNIALDSSMADEITPPNPALLKNTPVSSALQKRRSSTRSIKRKKFDDELVESSLTKSNYTRVRLSSTCSTSSLPPLMSSVPSTPITTTQPTTPVFSSVPSPALPEVAPPPVAETPPLVQPMTVTPETSVVTTSQPPVTMATMTTSTPMSVAPVETTASITSIIPTLVIPHEKKKSKSSSKRSKKTKPPPAGSTKDLGRWKPQDDLALINAVQQTCDLTAVYHGVKFTCNFTLKEIQERWYALMYDSVLSKLAVQAIKQLHPDIIAEVNSQALYSKDEENLIKTVTSTSQPAVETFVDLLSKNPTIFHSGRTGKALHNHWLLMKQYHLLPDQSVPPMPKGDHVLNFSDAEDMINEEELKEPTDEVLEQELSVADRRQKREIRHVEQELPKWQVLVDSVTGISPPDFDNQTLAVLRGRLVRYLMRSREITLGRANKDNQIDVDLSLEGPAWKISRRQGMIKLKSNGDFYIANEGKRPLYIDGKPVLYGSKQKLNNNSVVEISCLRFIFLINQDLISVIRQESQKAVT